MAFVATGFFLNVSFMDTGRNITTRRVQLQGADITEATSNAATVLAALQAATDCEVVAYSISSTFGEDAVVVPSGVELENTALLTMSVDGSPGKSAIFSLPGPKADLFVAASGPNYNVIDVVDPLVVAIVDLFRAGMQAFISDGETIADLKYGRRVHRRSSRSRTSRIG